MTTTTTDTAGTNNRYIIYIYIYSKRELMIFVRSLREQQVKICSSYYLTLIDLHVIDKKSHPCMTMISLFFFFFLVKWTDGWFPTERKNFFLILGWPFHLLGDGTQYIYIFNLFYRIIVMAIHSGVRKKIFRNFIFRNKYSVYSIITTSFRYALDPTTRSGNWWNW